MEPSDKLWDRINGFLENHTFQIESDYNFDTDFKIKLTGTKNYIVIGQETKFIEYTLYILPSNKQSDLYFELFKKYMGEEVDKPTTHRVFLNICYKTDKLLKSFLEMFGLNEYVICTKVINLVELKD
jgi:hypothetical protein